MNSVVLVGRLTKDVEVKTVGKDTQVAKFTLAVNRVGKDEADFISCTAFNKTAELMAKYLYKGSKTGVQGRIQTGSYVKDGITHYTTDVLVDRVEFLDGKKKETNDDFDAPLT